MASAGLGAALQSLGQNIRGANTRHKDTPLRPNNLRGSGRFPSKPQRHLRRPDTLPELPLLLVRPYHPWLQVWRLSRLPALDSSSACSRVGRGSDPSAAGSMEHRSRSVTASWFCRGVTRGSQRRSMRSPPAREDGILYGWSSALYIETRLRTFLRSIPSLRSTAKQTVQRTGAHRSAQR